MKPAINVLIPISMALFLSGCKSIPGLWETGSAQPAEPETVTETAQPVKPQLTLKELIEQDLAANRLSKPSGNNAIEKIERLRKQSPNDADIKRYEQSVIDRYLKLADKRMKRKKSPTRKDLETSLRYINTARSLQVPSPQLDQKEEDIIELLDIVIQKEQLEKARLADAKKQKLEAEKAAAAAVVEAPTVEEEAPAPAAIKPNPQINNPNFLALQQSQITARDQEINIQLDSISKRIVTEGATVIIHSQSMGDFRYLKSSLRTSLYWVDSNFNLSAEPHINDQVSPGIEIVPGN